MATILTEIKPNNLTEYKDWIYEKFRWDENAKNYYSSVTNTMKDSFEKSDFWLAFIESLDYTAEDYYIVTKYELLQANFKPKIYIKPYDSFLDKSFRKNVLLNAEWPNEPSNGWITFENAYGKIGDILRTSVIVRYLDGIDFVIKSLQRNCTENNQKCSIDYQAKTEGYYAVHIDVTHEFEIPSLTWESKKISASVEIQVTTQIKDVIKSLTHQLYEKDRLEACSEKLDWQWDYKSDRFVINYLGHIMHYLEGSIMEIRDKGEK